MQISRRLETHIILYNNRLNSCPIANSSDFALLIDHAENSVYICKLILSLICLSCANTRKQSGCCIDEKGRGCANTKLPESCIETIMPPSQCHFACMLYSSKCYILFSAALLVLRSPL